MLYLFLYFLILSFVSEFEIGKLFDGRSFLALLAGALLLTLPFCYRGMKLEDVSSVFGNKSVDAGLIQVFLLVFIRLSDDRAYEGLLPDLAMCFRPMLYAFCIRTVLEREGGDYDGEKKDDKKDGKPEQGGAEISAAENGGADIPVAPEAVTAQDCLAAGLTNRETEIALLVCRGRSNREIAQELFISEMTVKKHISNIFEKTGIGKREALRDAVGQFSSRTHVHSPEPPGKR